MERWEAAQLARRQEQRAEAEKTKRTRQVHVWVRASTLANETAWFPGVLSEWRRDFDGRRWLGRVAYVREWFSPAGSGMTPTLPLFEAAIIEEWAPASRIKLVHPLPGQPR